MYEARFIRINVKHICVSCNIGCGISEAGILLRGVVATPIKKRIALLTRSQYTSRGSVTCCPERTSAHVCYTRRHAGDLISGLSAACQSRSRRLAAINSSRPRKCGLSRAVRHTSGRGRGPVATRWWGPFRCSATDRESLKFRTCLGYCGTGVSPNPAIIF